MHDADSSRFGTLGLAVILMLERAAQGPRRASQNELRLCGERLANRRHRCIQTRTSA